MRIAQVSTYKAKTYNNSIKKQPKSISRNSNIMLNEFTLPSEVIRANFGISFGKFRKVASIKLIDKDTEKPVLADLKRDNIGKDFLIYKIYAGRKELGYMDLDCSAIFPEDNNYVVTEPDNEIPEITHLRSLAGDKYYGIGTALVNAAMEESIKRGKNGALWLRSEKGYAHALSDYRANENPLPFYYKLGFREVDSKTDKFPTLLYCY